MTTYLLERAVLPDGVHDDVLVEVVDGRFARSSRACCRARPSALPGLTIPGLANTHSHAFHRALRGRTQRERGSFWTWREQMYAVAERLDPDTYLALATADLPRDGRGGDHLRRRVPLPPPPARRAALRRAQRDGPRPGRGRPGRRAADHAARHALPLQRVRRAARGSSGALRDGSVHAWATGRRAGQHRLGAGRRRAPLRPRAPARPATVLAPLAGWAVGRPLHVHLSEQVAENDGCLAAYGVTPTRLLADHGVLGPLTTARPRHPSHRRRRRAARRARAFVSLLSDHRARPRRRRRPQPRARRRRARGSPWAPTATP